MVPIWDSVPWFVGGGAQHSPEVARLLAYAALNASEGIISPGDLKVTTLNVPGSSVRVLSGACAILSDAAGGAQQTYVGRNVSEDVVGISATGSGSGRSDLIVARVEDPFMAGEPYADPANPKVGPYIFTRVIPNVSPTTTVAPSGSSSIALARIDIPANTGTITAAMIKDLRRLVQPRTWSEGNVQNGPGTDSFLTTSQTSFTNWPPVSYPVTVPLWATHAQVRLDVTVFTEGNVQVDLRAQMGTLTGPTTYLDVNASASGGAVSNTQIAFAEFDVISLRGQTLTVRPQSRRVNTVESNGTAVVNYGAQTGFDVRFLERVV